MSEIRDIFEKITETYSVPVRIGSRCEATVFYRPDNLSPEDLEICSRYAAERIMKVSPVPPEVLINLPGGYTEFAQMLSRELADPAEPLDVIPYHKLDPENGSAHKIKGANVVLVNDVITTARSCLEAHTKITLIGANVLCWAALIDRTFGPGPVPVVAAFTGEPVTLIQGLS